MISTCSSSASSSSHGDALKCLRPRRAMTFTSVAPTRLAERQQSMAVLPTPMMITRGSILSKCPKCTLASHSMPMCTCDGASQRPGRSSSLPLGAPLPTYTASYPSSSSDLRLSTVVPYSHGGAHVDDVAALLVQHAGRQPERRDVHPHQSARLGVLFEDRDVVAQRQQVVGHRQRRRAGADERDALAVLDGGRLGQPVADVAAVVGGDALEAADGHRLLLHAPATAGRLAGTVAGAPEDAREDVRLAIEQVRVVVTAPAR